MSDKRIKLIQVIADSDLSGGPTHVLGILKNIDKAKYDVSLICPAGELSQKAKEIREVGVYNVSMQSKFDIVALLEIKTAIAKIRLKFDPFGPAIVHAHGTRAGLLARLFLTRKIKTVYTEHRWDADYHIKNKLNEKIQLWMSRKLNYKTDVIVAVSSSVKRFLLDKKLAPRDRIAVIPNGIDLEKSKIKYQISKVKEGNRHPIIGTISNLNVQKGHKYLIEAMAEVRKKYPLATLEIIGEGGERKSLEKLIERLKLGRNITLLGAKNEASKYIKNWNVFVLPSIAETFGIVILEAMAAGVPVIAARVGGVADIITNDKNGLLVAPKNPKFLADAICKIIEHPVLAAKLKREGLERVKDFDWKKVIIQLDNQYNKLIV